MRKSAILKAAAMAAVTATVASPGAPILVPKEAIRPPKYARAMTR